MLQVPAAALPSEHWYPNRACKATPGFHEICYRKSVHFEHPRIRPYMHIRGPAPEILLTARADYLNSWQCAIWSRTTAKAWQLRMYAKLKVS